MKKNKKKKNNLLNTKNLLFLIITLLVIISLGTYAWLSYRTNDTAMVLTVGNINNVRVTLSPYQINAKANPVAAYTSGIMTDVEAINNNTASKKFVLYFKIDTIDTALRDSGFKYTITRATSGNTYTVYQNGNFANAVSNSDLTILEETLPNGATYKYKVYVWVDSSSGNQSAMQGKSFIAELRAEIVSIPSQYQQVEYLESSGTQYILTDIIPTNTTGVSAKVSTANNSADKIYFGSKGSNDSRFWVGNSSGNLYFGWNTVLSTRSAISTGTAYLVEMNYFNNRKTMLNSSTTNTISASLASGNSYKISIFGGNLAGTVSYLSSIRIYDIKFTNNGEVIAHFVPCYDTYNLISGNTYDAGLYDLVTNTYYGNDGSGNFSYGASV